MGAYDPQGREIISSFARVMEHLGTSYGVLKKETMHGRSGAAPRATIWCSSNWPSRIWKR